MKFSLTACPFTFPAHLMFGSRETEEILVCRKSVKAAQSKLNFSELFSALLALKWMPWLRPAKNILQPFDGL